MYSDDKLILMGKDELFHEFHIAEMRIPFPPGELSDEELDAMKEVFERRHEDDIPEETWFWWVETTYKTSDAIKAEEEEEEEEFEEYLEEFDGDEDAAWQAYCDDQREARYGW